MSFSLPDLPYAYDALGPYRNRRPDYLKAVVDHLVNWEYVAARLW